MKTLTEAQETALRTLAINGSSTKSTSAIRALVRKGLVTEQKRAENSSVFRVAAQVSK